MKELSVEQKAKAYDEAKLRIRAAYNSNRCTIGFMNEIFPELKESEDEKIKNKLIHLIKMSSEVGGLALHKWEADEMLTWLEKQVEKMSDPRYSILDKLIEADNIYQMSVNEAMVKEAKNKAIEALSNLEISKLLGLEKQDKQKYKFRVGDTIKEKSTGDIVTICEIDLKNREYRLTNTGFIPFKYEYLWELVEQKPADKVEPKFKVGDWIVSGYNSVAYIESISETKYNLQCKDGSHEKLSVDYINRCWHLWAIQDAKDGDVLSDGTTIFIFKDLLSDGSVMSYCDYDANSGESDAFCPLSVNLVCSKITLATKEQRDLLFTKMREAGYEWDDKKKEPKKIIDEKQIKKNLQDNSFRRMFEQKSAWSEKDEERFKRIATFIWKNRKGDTDEIFQQEQDVNWLKSLKERIGE